MLDLRTAGAVILLAGIGLVLSVRRRGEAGPWASVGLLLTGIGITILLEWVASGNRGP